MITRVKKGHYIMIHQEAVTIVNIDVPNIGAPNCIKQILTVLKGEIDNTIIVRAFSIPLSTMDRSSRQKINK